MNFQSIKFRIIALGVALLLLGTLVRYFVALPMFQERVRELIAAQQLSIASHRIASHRIASHRIASHRIASHRIVRRA